MIFSDEMGIFINDEIVLLLKTALQQEGRKSRLARAMDITESNIGHWLGDTQQKGMYILWDQWKKVRAYLVKAELIDAEDPRWMLPSQMRERLSAIGAGQGDDNIRRLIYCYSQLNENGQAALMKMAESLTTTPGFANYGSRDRQTSEAE